MPIGRPTEFSDELEAQAWEYIENYEEYGHALPSLVGLCKVIKRSKSTIYDWAKRNDNGFSDILAAINEQQELVAWNKGLKGEYNSNLVKLLLGKHGYHDKQDNTHAGPDGGAVKTEVTWSVQPVKPVDAKDTEG